MGPISSYKELIQTLNWDEKKRKSERWYIFLVMNPQNQTNAGIDIIKNFSYLNARTGNVTFFYQGSPIWKKELFPIVLIMAVKSYIKTNLLGIFILTNVDFLALLNG